MLIPLSLAKGMKTQDRPSDSDRFPTAIHPQSQVKTRRKATVTATTSLTTPSRTKMRRGQALSRPHLTIANRKVSAGNILNSDLSANVHHAPNPIGALSSHTPHLVTVCESRATLSTAAEAGPFHMDETRIRPQHSKPVDAEALALRESKTSSSDNDGGLSGSDLNLSSDDDGCSSEDKQGRSRTSEHSP